MQWGMPYGIANRTGQPDHQEVTQILRTARANGVHFIDTARSYDDAEGIIGRLVGTDPYWTVCTKLEGELGDAMDCAGALGAASRSLSTSRKELKCDHLAIVLLHRFEHLTICSGGVWDLLVRERTRGSIGKIGISATDPQEAIAALDDPNVEVIQVPANLADQRLLRAGFFERARRKGVMVIVRSVFLQGALLLPSDQLPRHLRGLRRLLDAIDREAVLAGCSREDLLFAHVRRLGDYIVVGCESARQLQTNIESWKRSEPLQDPGPKLADIARSVPSPVINPWEWPR